MTVPSGYLNFFFSRKKEREEITEVRRTMLDKFFFIFLLAGLPAVVFGAIRAYMLGKWGFSIIYIGSYVLFALGTLALRKFSFRIRAMVLVTPVFLVSLASLVTVGLSGSGLQLMLGVCFLVVLLIGFRGGMLAILISLVSITVVAIGIMSGFIEIYPEQKFLSRMALAWSTTICVFFMIVSVTVIGFQMFTKRIEESLDLLEEHKLELESANEHLREASVIISKSRVVAFLWSNREGWPVEYVSDNVENVFGYTAGEFLMGQTVYSSAIHPEDLPRVAGEVSRYSRDPGREGFTHEPYRIVTKQGEVRWVEDTTQVRRDSRGEITHYQGIVQDITERKRAEEKLNEANSRLQMLQQITASVHSTLDLEGVFSQITDSFVYSMGYNSALIIKRNDKTNWFEVKTLSSKKWILTEVDKLLGFTLENYSFPVNIGLNAAVIAAMRGEIVIAKTAEEVLYPLISKTTCSMLQEFGGIKNYILVPLQVDKEVVGGVIITTAREEVSEEEFKMVNLFAQAASHAIQNANLHTLTQQAKEALRESEERFRLLAENARDTIWTMDMNLQYTYMSPYVKQSLDYTPEEFMAKPFNEILTPASLELCMKVLAEELEIEKRENKDLLRSRTIEVEGIHRNGNIVWAEFKMTFMRNAAGQATGILGYTRDINERKKAEEALQQSEEKYRLIAENMADVIAILDMNLRFTYISPSVRRIRGFTSEEAMEQTLDQVMTPESLKIALTAFEEEMKLEASGTADPDGIRTMEVEEYRKDGSSIWLEVSLSFLRDENQKAVGILSVSRDISERKRAEDALRKSEEYFRAITENTSDVIFIVDELGTITYTSPSIERFIGYSPDELIGTSSLDLILPDDHPRAIEDFGKALLTKEVVIPNSFRIIHKDGTERIMEGVGMNLMDNPAIAGFVMNVRDVTDRKRAEEKLRESEKMYRELYDFLPIPVYEMDLEANITSVNRAIYETFGGTEEDLKKGFRAWQLLSPEEIEKSSKNIQRLLKGEQIEGTEYTLMRLDGSVFPAIVISSVIYSNGKPVGLRGAIVDITERRQAEEERRNLETKLQRAQKMEALGLMAGGVAHDLNNMLSAFVSLPELMLMDIPEKNQKLRREIQMIMSSGQRTAAIVDDLLTITRGVTMARDVLNLNKVVQEYMRSPEFQKLRQFHPGIEVVTELADDLLPIRGSRVHLMKALMNLVSNASEAFRSSDSGVVSVSTQNRYVDTPLEGYERINIGEYAVLVVRDNGLGISPEDMERIFEPFYTKKVMGRSGTGLGLSVVWNTVTGHDGYIHVESGSGGTGFELYFPITRESVSEQEKPLDLKQYQGRGEKVLVVDDELDQRVIAVDILSKLGYQADAVSGGQEALEFLKEHEVDILLLDMVMPGMDGCETFRRIVQLKPGQKAVIASGFSLSDRVKKAQGLGAGAYIRKPYSVEKLGLAIKTKLDKSL